MTALNPAKVTASWAIVGVISVICIVMGNTDQIVNWVGVLDSVEVRFGSRAEIIAQEF
jgi:hypothetical protein